LRTGNGTGLCHKALYARPICQRYRADGERRRYFADEAAKGGDKGGDKPKGGKPKADAKVDAEAEAPKAE